MAVLMHLMISLLISSLVRTIDLHWSWCICLYFLLLPFMISCPSYLPLKRCKQLYCNTLILVWPVYFNYQYYELFLPLFNQCAMLNWMPSWTKTQLMWKAAACMLPYFHVMNVQSSSSRQVSSSASLRFQGCHAACSLVSSNRCIWC